MVETSSKNQSGSSRLRSSRISTIPTKTLESPKLASMAEEESWASSSSSMLPYSNYELDPTPEELIAHFLKNHILREPYPESGFIQEDTLYGEDLSPWEKFCDDHNPYPWVGEGDPKSTPTLFLFTKLSDVGSTEKSSGIQKNRKAGCGAWHTTNSQQEVESFVDGEISVIGHFRVLNFRCDNNEETVGQWTMYEYTISADAFPGIRKVKGWQNQVICKIKRVDAKSNVGGKVTDKNKRKSSSKPPASKRRRQG